MYMVINMINSEELDKYINETIKDNTLNKINNLYLSNKQIQILEMYDIDYKNVINMSDLIFKIEDYINENYDDDMSDLEALSQELSEFNYYHNTNK